MFDFLTLNEQACQVLVPGIFTQCQIQGARTSHGKVCLSFKPPTFVLSRSSSSPSSFWSCSSSSLSWSSSTSTFRSAILGEQRNNYFCDVACGRGEMVSPITDIPNQRTKYYRHDDPQPTTYRTSPVKENLTKYRTSPLTEYLTNITQVLKQNI